MNEKLDYTGLPFWEKRRGYGPLTKAQRDREKLRKKLRRVDTIEGLQAKLEILDLDQRSFRRDSISWQIRQVKINEVKEKLTKLGASYKRLPSENYECNPDYEKTRVRIEGTDGNGNRWVSKFLTSLTSYLTM